MKQGICIAWMILVGLQAGYQGLVHAYYALQKEQITKNFCENKDQPALKCNGKCHLKTMLAANEDPELGAKESSTPPEKIHPQPLIGLLQPLTGLSTNVVLPSILLWSSSNKEYYEGHYEYLAAFELLDPPQETAFATLS